MAVCLVTTMSPLLAVAQEAVEDACRLDKNKTCERDYSDQNIIWYRPKDEPCSPSGGSGSSVTSLRGAENREKIYNYLKDAGLTANQAAGVLGNIKVESGGTYSPTIQEFGKGFGNWGYGLVQWTNPSNGSEGRRTNLVNFLNQRHPDLMAKYYREEYSRSPGSYSGEEGGFVPKNANTGESMPIEDNDKLLLAQLDFLYQESTTRTISSSSAKRGLGSAGDNEWETVKSKDEIKWASDVWVYNFEIPGDIDATALHRVDEGNEIFAMYNGGGAGGAATPGSSAAACGSANDTLTGPMATRVVQRAEQELALWESREMKPGNDYEKYSFGYKDEWCALFVSWIYKEVGFPVDVSGSDYALVVSGLENMGKNKVGGRFEWHAADGVYTPRPGDIAIYAKNGGTGENYHTNIVVSASSPNSMVTIGGNEGSDGIASGITSTRVKKAEGDYWPGQAKGYVSIVEPAAAGAPNATN